jgi:hypothetical protein
MARATIFRSLVMSASGGQVDMTFAGQLSGLTQNGHAQTTPVEPEKNVKRRIELSEPAIRARARATYFSRRSSARPVGDLNSLTL